MKPALLPLTSFRFFAAVAVVTCHRPRTGPSDWLPYERHGAAGVTFFFLLSGFILAYTYHDRFLARRPGVVREFLVARLARILPAYLLAFAFAVWLLPQGKDLLTGKFGSALWPAVAHLTMTQALVPYSDWYFGYNAPAWSLSCEWTFYLAFPLLLLGLATGSARRRVAVFAAASAVWAGVFVAYQIRKQNPGFDGSKWFWLVYVCPLTRVFDFVCGVALGVLFVRLAPAIGPARGGRYWLWGLAEVGALAGLWATLHFCPRSAALNMLTGQGYYLPGFALIVWVGALGRGPLTRAASWAPLVYLGELSYGIYIFHAVAILSVPMYYRPEGMSVTNYVRVLLAIAAVVTLSASALSYHFWETPIRRWVRGRVSKPGAKEPPAATAVPQPARRAA